MDTATATTTDPATGRTVQTTTFYDTVTGQVTGRKTVTETPGAADGGPAMTTVTAYYDYQDHKSREVQQDWLAAPDGAPGTLYCASQTTVTYNPETSQKTEERTVARDSATGGTVQAVTPYDPVTGEQGETVTSYAPFWYMSYRTTAISSSSGQGPVVPQAQTATSDTTPMASTDAQATRAALTDELTSLLAFYAPTEAVQATTPADFMQAYSPQDMTRLIQHFNEDMDDLHTRAHQAGDYNFYEDNRNREDAARGYLTLILSQKEDAVAAQEAQRKDAALLDLRGGLGELIEAVASFGIRQLFVKAQGPPEDSQLYDAVQQLAAPLTAAQLADRLALYQASLDRLYAKAQEQGVTQEFDQVWRVNHVYRVEDFLVLARDQKQAAEAKPVSPTPAESSTTPSEIPPPAVASPVSTPAPAPPVAPASAPPSPTQTAATPPVPAPTEIPKDVAAEVPVARPEPAATAPVGNPAPSPTPTASAPPPAAPVSPPPVAPASAPPPPSPAAASAAAVETPQAVPMPPAASTASSEAPVPASAASVSAPAASMPAPPPPAARPTGTVTVANDETQAGGIVLTLTAPPGTEALGSWDHGQTWGRDPVPLTDGTFTMAIATPPWTPGPQEFLVKYRTLGDPTPWSEIEAVAGALQYGPPVKSPAVSPTEPPPETSSDLPTLPAPVPTPEPDVLAQVLKALTGAPAPPQANAPADALTAAPTPTQPLVAIQKLPTGVQLEIRGPAGAAAYVIYAKTDVTGPWERVSGNVPADSSGVTAWKDPRNPAQQQFYKVEVAPTLKGVQVALEELPWGVETTPIPAYAQEVFLDPSKDHGDVLLANGQKTGQYVFYPLGMIQGKPQFVLKLTYWVNQKEDWQSTKAHLYLVNENKNQFQFLGSSRFYQDPVAPGQAFYVAVARFLADPLALSQTEYVLLIDRPGQGTLLVDRAFIAQFVPRYLDRLLTGLVNTPQFRFAAGTDPLTDNSGFRGYWDNVVSAASKTEIVKRLQQAWDQLAPSARELFLTHLQTGNAEAMTRLGDLLVRYLDERASTSPAQAQRGIPSAILPAIKNVLQTWGVEPAVQGRLVKRALAELNARSPLEGADASNAVDFIYTAIVKNDGLTLNASQYRPEISEVLGKVLRDNPLGQNAVWQALSDLSSYAPPEALQGIEGKLAGELSSYQGDAQRARVLLAALRWPISGDTKRAIEAAIGSTDFQRWSLSELHTVLDQNGMSGMSPQGQDVFFKKVAETLSSKLDAQEIPASPFDGQEAPSKEIMARSAAFMKQSGTFQQTHQYFTGIVQRFNPRHQGESDAAYAARLAKVLAIWDQGVVVVDVRESQQPDAIYLDGILEVSKNHRGWEMIFLEPGKPSGMSYPGMVELGTVQGTRTLREVIGTQLLHEGGHAVIRKAAYETRILDTLIHNFYYNYITRTKGDFDVPNFYGLTDTEEYGAEFVKYWYEDSRGGLTTALTNYQAGHPAMLNMFLAIWNTISTPADTPAGQLPLFALPDSGLLTREWIPGGWARGDMADGVFTFTLDGTTYTVTYQDYKIVRVP